MSLKNFIFALIISTVALATAGCAGSSNSGADETAGGATTVVGDTDYYADSSSGDPLEGFNRAVFQFNRYTDMLIIKPITQLYVHALPSFVRQGVHNFLTNLNTPVVLANELLQWDWHGANVVTKRFVINSTVGMAGLFDVAEYNGLEALPHEDFGQTLGKWGIGEGAYIMLPILGPSNLRDATGFVVDLFLDPVNWWGWNNDKDGVLFARTAMRVIDARAGLLGPYDDLLEQSIDPYITLKSAYIQNRAELVRDGGMGGHDDGYDSYDFFEDDF